MRMRLEGEELFLTAEKGDPWKGDILGSATVEHPSHGTLLNCGQVKMAGKYQTLLIKLATRPELAALVRDWEAAKKAAHKAKEAEAAAARKRLETGENLIEVSYCDGEYLSGYTTYGYGGELLLALGLASEVSGWGIHVKNAIVDALGKKFTYPAAAEYARPALEAAEAEKTGKAKQRKDNIQAAQRKAVQTGEPVAIQQWAETRYGNYEGYEGDYLFIVTRYVRANGTTFTKAVNTY